MRVLVIGATGAIGRAVVPVLTDSGHEVVATSGRGGARLAEAGGTFEQLDLLDRSAVLDVVKRHRPDAIVHLATAIPAQINPRKVGEQFVLTNRLRTEGTRNLVAAVEASNTGAGAVRLITQSYAAYEPGHLVRREVDPLWPNPPRVYAGVVQALRELEQLTQSAHGIALRFGHLYGPGTIFAPDGSLTTQVRAGKVPIVGSGGSLFSFVHVDDAASAVLAAVDSDSEAVMNIVDDEPTPVGVWLPRLAAMVDARPPRRVPPAIARLAIGPFGVAFMGSLSGVSNARARRMLQWRPRYATWTIGSAADFAPAVAIRES